ncbi:MAG: hypothetical protein JKY50_22600 [Oleispira sp.]|nr:hypothetical protein [Oleispira sp.]
MSMKVKAERLILEWVKKEPVDILNRYFVDEFIDITGAKYQQMPFGANKCGYLNRTLSRMHKEKKLTRFTIGLHSMEAGFPNWVFSYDHNDNAYRPM